MECDTKKDIHYHELGAMKGDVNARFALGMLEVKEVSLDRALKHYMNAIEGGDYGWLMLIRDFYTQELQQKMSICKGLTCIRIPSIFR